MCEGCLECSDFSGCINCDTNNGYIQHYSNVNECGYQFSTCIATQEIQECIEPCSTNNCLGLGENPYCDPLKKESWGCPKNGCLDGYFQESIDYPCVSCTDTLLNCEECVDYNGCTKCKDGYTKRWDSSCGYGLFICV